MRRQSEAPTPLSNARGRPATPEPAQAKAVSRFACHRTPYHQTARHSRVRSASSLPRKRSGLAGAFRLAAAQKSGSKLHALHALRVPRNRQRIWRSPWSARCPRVTIHHHSGSCAQSRLEAGAPERRLPAGFARPESVRPPHRAPDRAWSLMAANTPEWLRPRALLPPPPRPVATPRATTRKSKIGIAQNSLARTPAKTHKHGRVGFRDSGESQAT